MSQKDRILAHLKAGRSITPIMALTKFGCFRLAARIDEIRHQGFDVVTSMVADGDRRYAKYKLISGAKPNA